MKLNPLYAAANEDGTLTYAPVPLVVDGVNFWTNIPEKYAQAGYFPVENTEMPVKDGFYYTGRYELKDGKAVRVWDEHEITIPEEEATEGGT